MERTTVPKTGKMLAVKLDLPASKMRYHLTALEKAGLVEIERTEVINGIVQKFYRPIAKDIRREGISLIQYTGKSNNGAIRALQMALERF
ncbi:helix-turn-helix domain-containing protein [Lentibacillus sp. CBA3610]|uniref:winged helix-turn-helix domain-containing protein n=1 Tax=Lentibacillus sp. CBA3610 TaxID=2518176 RepID=UPI0015950EF6|nr:helix-turn-helix domain-containing protein [Lentibacillus sp. CBA3610]QKY70532.1 ArsR family transcriptional regulator [Lentibacillus sp. CBA3610]